MEGGNSKNREEKKKRIERRRCVLQQWIETKLREFSEQNSGREERHKEKIKDDLDFEPEWLEYIYPTFQTQIWI